MSISGIGSSSTALKFRKFGFCKMAEAWVPRDDMLGMNIKAFDENNQEHRIQVRLSPEEWYVLVDQLKKLQWKNDLRLEDEIPIDQDIIDEPYLSV